MLIRNIFSKITRNFISLNLLDKLTIISYFLFIFILSLLASINKLSPTLANSNGLYLCMYIVLSIFFLISSFWLINNPIEFYKLLAPFTLLISIISLFAIQVCIISIFNINSLLSLIIITLTYVFSLILILIKIYRLLGYTTLDRFFSIIYGLMSYFTIILDAGFMLFLYYSYRKYISSEYIENFNNLSGIKDFIRLLCNTSINKINNYTDNLSPVPLSFKLPYYFGKLLDSFLLVYVFTRFTASKPKSLLVNKNRKLQEENRKLRESKKVLLVSYLLYMNSKNEELSSIKADYEAKIKTLNKDNAKLKVIIRNNSKRCTND